MDKKILFLVVFIIGIYILLTFKHIKRYSGQGGHASVAGGNTGLFQGDGTR